MPALYAPPTRIGWVFRDRRLLAVPFSESPPPPPPPPVREQDDHAAAERAYRATLKRITPISAALFVLFALMAGCDKVLFSSETAIGLAILAVLVGAPGLILTAIRYARVRSASAALAHATAAVPAQHQQAVAGWQQRRHDHERAEAARIDALDEWGPAVVPENVRRIDVFGGSLWGWEALLTAHGASILPHRRLLVADLSGELVCRELAVTAAEAGRSADVALLPSQLPASGVLSGLSPAQFADALCEAMHAGAPAASSREQRAIDARVLEQVTAALGGQVTFARLTAAIQALLGNGSPGRAASGQASPGPLNRSEHDTIASLFSASYRTQVQPNLVRIESFLAPLAAAGEPAEPGVSGLPAAGLAAQLRCVALEPGGRSVRTEALAALTVQWLTTQITTAQSAGDTAPAVIIAGADEIARPHIERLSDACERHGVPLTLLFRHLRETAAEVAGGGAIAFMRLGNHAEAATAADLIGRRHKFVLTRLTAALGGSETHARTDTEGWGESKTTARGWSQGTATGALESGLGLLGGGVGRHLTRGESRSWSVSRDWSVARSWAEGTNWSDAGTTQRVYEYTVEPTVLQHLPDHALLLVTTRLGGQPSLQAVECDPAIITLPRVSTEPLAPPPQQIPAAPAQPAWQQPPPAAQPQPIQPQYQHGQPIPPGWQQPPPGPHRTPSPPW